jgi:hypothetical protein
MMKRICEWLKKNNVGNPKLYIGGDEVSHTKYEELSNQGKIGVIAGNDRVAHVLLILLRIIVDKNPDLLEDSLMMEADGLELKETYTELADLKDDKWELLMEKFGDDRFITSFNFNDNVVVNVLTFTLDAGEVETDIKRDWNDIRIYSPDEICDRLFDMIE